MINNDFGMMYHIDYPGIWVEYNGWRVKDPHDIMLMDGTIVEGCYPNACAWSGDKGRYEDTEVRMVRFIPDNEMKSKCRHWGIGEWRRKRNIDYFGDVLPLAIKHDGGTLLLPRVVGKLREKLDELFKPEHKEFNDEMEHIEYLLQKPAMCYLGRDYNYVMTNVTDEEGQQHWVARWYCYSSNVTTFIPDTEV